MGWILKLKCNCHHGKFSVLSLFTIFTMNSSIIFQNYQGVSSSDFRRAFKSLISAYKAEIVVLLEPKVSRLKGDKFTKLRGFDRSHRVKANGFSGRIWLLWNDRFTADIVINHKQFIHFKVTDTNGYGPGSPPFMLALLMYLH